MPGEVPVTLGLAVAQLSVSIGILIASGSPVLQLTEWQPIGNQIDAAMIFARAAKGQLHRLVRPRARSFPAHGILNAFQRLSSSAGETSSTCVATHQTLPHGSLTPPYRSPEGKVMMGNTETPPARSAD